MAAFTCIWINWLMSTHTCENLQGRFMLSMMRGVLHMSIFMLIPQKYNIVLWSLVNAVCWVQVKWMPWKEGFKNPQQETPIQWNYSHNSYIYSCMKLQSHHWYSIKVEVTGHVYVYVISSCTNSCWFLLNICVVIVRYLLYLWQDH